MKTVLVTGGNRGIGLEICRQLGSLGWRVYMGCRDKEQGSRAANSLDGDIIPVQLDVTSTDSIRASFNEVAELDVLVNNAGLFGEKSFRDPDMEEIKSIMDTNLLGVIEVTKYFLMRLRRSNDARIINVSSGMGSWSDLNSSYGAYRLSKVSLNAFTVMLASEVTGKVKVNAMCPGWVQTDMGGSNAPRSVADGADTAVWLATSDKIPHGKFIRDRKIISW